MLHAPCMQWAWRPGVLQRCKVEGATRGRACCFASAGLFARSASGPLRMGMIHAATGREEAGSPCRRPRGEWSAATLPPPGWEIPGDTPVGCNAIDSAFQSSCCLGETVALKIACSSGRSQGPFWRLATRVRRDASPSAGATLSTTVWEKIYGS